MSPKLSMPENRDERMFDGRRGAVSLTFDDGTANQLAKAIPPLDARNLKGTFYLNPRDRLIKDFFQYWKAVAAAGHEIGNHTLSHPCPSAITGARGLEDMSLDEVEADIISAQERLVSLAPHQDEWTFAYPCYATYVGKGVDRTSYVPVVARHFAGGRAGGEYGFANRPGLMDYAALAGTPVERLSGAETIELISRLTSEGQWVILIFHDIGEGVLPFREGDYLDLLDFLAASDDDIQTAPVIDIVRLSRRNHDIL